MKPRFALMLVAALLAVGLGFRTNAKAADDAALDETMDASGADGDGPRRKLVRWNEYEGPWITARFGAGFLYDFAGYAQDNDSQEQRDWSGDQDIRDARILVKGRFPKFERLSYTLGYMYDNAEGGWFFRQTGLMFNVPELHGQIFVGRTKEGISTNKLMVGYQGWTNERSAANDAFHPILADGIKWMGTSPGGELVYSLGAFDDELSDTEGFNKYDHQFVGRAVYLPFLHTDPERVLHLATAYRWAKSLDGELQLKSKPESFLAQTSAVDTGSFNAKSMSTVTLETYYRPGPTMVGMEYYLNKVDSSEFDDPFFHGGEIFIAHILTGEVRPYNTRGAFFDRISPARPVGSGGFGAWELVARFSYVDLDDGAINGGKFWRITPMVNWHMTDNFRLEFVYGYGELDRFETVGGTHFFQSRIQFQL